MLDFTNGSSAGNETTEWHKVVNIESYCFGVHFHFTEFFMPHESKTTGWKINCTKQQLDRRPVLNYDWPINNPRQSKHTTKPRLLLKLEQVVLTKACSNTLQTTHYARDLAWFIIPTVSAEGFLCQPDTYFCTSTMEPRPASQRTFVQNKPCKATLNVDGSCHGRSLHTSVRFELLHPQKWICLRGVVGKTDTVTKA